MNEVLDRLRAAAVTAVANLAEGCAHETACAEASRDVWMERADGLQAERDAWALRAGELRAELDDRKDSYEIRQMRARDDERMDLRRQVWEATSKAIKEETEIALLRERVERMQPIVDAALVYSVMSEPHDGNRKLRELCASYEEPVPPRKGSVADCHCCCQRPAVRRAVHKRVMWNQICQECLDRNFPESGNTGTRWNDRACYFEPDGELMPPHHMQEAMKMSAFPPLRCGACEAGRPMIWYVQGRKMMHEAQGLSVTPCTRVEWERAQAKRKGKA